MSFFSKLWDRLKGAPPPAPSSEAPKQAGPVEPAAAKEQLAATGQPEQAELQQEQEATDEVGRRWSDSDDASLEERARGLDVSGEAAEAMALLLRDGMVLGEHTSDEGLPCLCRRCLVPGELQVERGGLTFQRDFVVARRRVLFYWAPTELGSDAEKLRYSMRNALRARVHELNLARWRRLPKVNPFTGQPLS